MFKFQKNWLINKKKAKLCDGPLNVDASEQYERRGTLIMYGRNLPAVASIENCKEIVRNILRQYQRPSLCSTGISIAHRLGKRPKVPFTFSFAHLILIMISAWRTCGKGLSRSQFFFLPFFPLTVPLLCPFPLRNHLRHQLPHEAAFVAPVGRVNGVERVLAARKQINIRLQPMSEILYTNYVVVI